MLVSIETFKALAKITDRESSRYALGCILLERSADGSPVAVATDGRRLTSFQWVEPDGHPLATSGPVAGFSALVSAEAIKQIAGWKLDKRALRLRPELGFVFVDENGPAIPLPKGAPRDAEPEYKLPIRATDGAAVFTIDNARGEGRFPKWRDVLPEFKADDCKSVMLDPRYVAELCDVAKALATSEESRGVTFIVNNAERPIVAIAERADGSRATSVLMPLARDGEPTIPAAYDRARDNRTWAERIRHFLLRLQVNVTCEPCADEPRDVELYSTDCATFGRYSGRELRDILANTAADIAADKLSARIGPAKRKESEPAAEPAAEPGKVRFTIVEPFSGAVIGRVA